MSEAQRDQPSVSSQEQKEGADVGLSPVKGTSEELVPSDGQGPNSLHQNFMGHSFNSQLDAMDAQLKGGSMVAISEKSYDEVVASR